jgi:lipoprotein NlpD
MPTNRDPWAWPASGKVIETFSTSGRVNKGIDIAGQRGQPIQSTRSGKVVYSGTGIAGYGNLIIIKHDETYLSAYAHSEKVLVKEGDEVKAGQKIAEMGDSGTDRVMLHFEIRREGKPVDPLGFLPRR